MDDKAREGGIALIGLPPTGHLQSHRISIGVDKVQGEEGWSNEVYPGAGERENNKGVQ